MLARIHGIIWMGVFLGMALVFILFSAVDYQKGSYGATTGDVVIALFFIAAAAFPLRLCWPSKNNDHFPPSIP